MFWFEIYCRVYQAVMRLVAYLLPWRRQVILSGPGSLRQLPLLISQRRIQSVLLVTDKGVTALGLLTGLQADLDQAGIRCAIYDQTHPNPTIENIEAALLIYRQESCQGIIAAGGGSPIDCAKGVAARLARPRKPIARMRGLLKVLGFIPPLFVVPTTAGTGSESTIVAVIMDAQSHEKYAITDISLLPHVAVHEPGLTTGLPPHLTATTGLDALTHAVEAYIGQSNTPQTRRWAKEACALIFQHLPRAWDDGQDLQARAAMQQAAYLAGRAFTRAYVGNVHAMAHALGGLYAVPHGLANAVLLPHVLAFYGEDVSRPLAELADHVGLGGAGDSTPHKAALFLDSIRKLNATLQIPDKIVQIQAADLPLLVERSFREANPFYPVPRIIQRGEFRQLFEQLQP